MTQSAGEAHDVLTCFLASLYLGITTCKHHNVWDQSPGLARLGALTAPGHFYGPATVGPVPIALTCTDSEAGQAVVAIATSRA